jgi:hypothetical protein
MNLRILLQRIQLTALKVEHALTHASAIIQETFSSWAEDRRYALAKVHYTERTESVKDREFYYDRVSQAMLQGSRDAHRRCEVLERQIDIVASQVVDGVHTSTFEEDLRRYYDEALPYDEPKAFGN